ncbi:hypothetical protein CALCODRAFT_494909 [Calocera cornea HHB12733]|uniref:Zn(2)-C6 fungal-type domain-containing protein n=1 Tax=Calocera cornea HHB12733 TaxID=1353952 RepID=A0A165GSH4_9BASI|nr:hypothetical protein CALCODRAFT_494909 [Calocera cornea HHB12733]
MPNAVTYEPFAVATFPYQIPSQLSFPGTYMLTPPGSLSPPLQASPVCDGPPAHILPTLPFPHNQHTARHHPSSIPASHSPVEHPMSFELAVPIYHPPHLIAANNVFPPDPPGSVHDAHDVPNAALMPDDTSFNLFNTQQSYAQPVELATPPSATSEWSNSMNSIQQPSPAEVNHAEQEAVQYNTPPLSESVESEEDSDSRRLYGMQCRKKNGHPHVACYHCKHRKMKCEGKVYDKDGRPWCQPCIDRQGPCYWPTTYHRYIMEDHAQAIARVHAALRGSPIAPESEPDAFDPNKCFERKSWSWGFNELTGRNEFDERPQQDGRKRRRRAKVHNWWDVFSMPPATDTGN